jgi:hypothetical protein
MQIEEIVCQKILPKSKKYKKEKRKFKKKKEKT